MRHVLIVDDAATVRQYHRQVLEAAGYAVSEAANGLEGLEKALQGPVDLMLVDVNMPRMDGYSLLAELRGRPELAAVPVIIITTEPLERHEDQAIEHGANLCLLKPVLPETLQLYAGILTGGDA